MNLTETVKFLSPAIDKENSILPVLDHVRLQGGYAIAYDGELAMCCPCDLPLTASPRGWTLEKAVEMLPDGYQVVQLPNGDLEFVSASKESKRRVVVPCTTDEFPVPDFNYVNPLPSPANLREVLKSLLPFVYDKPDPNRPWINTVLLRHGKAVATGIHTMAWRSLDIPQDVDVNIPLKAVRAMLSTKDDPAWIACTQMRFVAIYSDGRFLSTPSVATSWPDAVATLIQPVIIDKDATPLLAAMGTVTGFVPKDDHFYFVNGTVATEADGRGASCELDTPAGLAGKFITKECYSLIHKLAKRFSINGDVFSWRGDSLEGRYRLTRIPSA